MRLSLPLLVVGLLLGGLVGWFTRPQAAEIRLPGVTLEVQSDRPAGASGGGSMTTGQWQHVGAFALGGALIGFAAGFVADRRRA